MEFGKFINNEENKSIHIGLSQPVRVEKGKAKIQLPGLYDYNGNINSEIVDISLEPSGREMNLMLGYKDEINSKTVFGLQYSLTKDYGHIANNDLVNNIFASLEIKF